MTKKEAEYLLYRFLRTNGIMTRYCYNSMRYCPNFAGYYDRRKICEGFGLKNSKGRYMIESIVNYYVNKCDGMPTYVENLFNFAPSSFHWDESEEGIDFWQSYKDKWNKFVNDIKYEKIK